MIEFDALSLLQKERLKIRFSSDEYGQIGIARQCFPGQWIASDRGVCFELVEELKTRSVVSDGLHWFRFRARSMGAFFLKFKLSQQVIQRVVELHPEMTCHYLDEIIFDHFYKFDFKRTKTPFVAVWREEGPSLFVFVEYYADNGRVAFYTGSEDNGLGGFIFVCDVKELKVF